MWVHYFACTEELKAEVDKYLLTERFKILKSRKGDPLKFKDMEEDAVEIARRDLKKILVDNHGAGPASSTSGTALCTCCFKGNPRVLFFNSLF